MQSLLLHLSHLGSVPPLHGVVLPIGSSCCLPVDIVTCLLFVIQDMHEGDMLCACFGIHASGVQHHCQLSDVQYNHLDASDMTQITISSHHLLKSGLSVSPFLVCWDTWLCWSPPPWWAQHPFPAEYGSLWSLPLLISPLLHPVLGVSKTAFEMVDTKVDSLTMVKTVHLTLLMVSLQATRELSVALLYSGHCSLFTTLSTGTYSTSIFSGTGVQATVPNVSYSQQLVPVYLSHFKWVFLMLQRCCTVPPVSPATGGLSTMPLLLLQLYESYVLYCCTALLSTSAAA
jgi:hypothetical protein